MGIYSLLPAVLCVCLAYATAAVIGRFSKPIAEKNRFVSVDGVRGYLAFLVFLHHTTIWYFYFRTNDWQPPASVVYEHFGKGSVALFFMITGLLFWTKIINSEKKPVNWNHLYISRIFRITPLYLTAVLLMFVIVMMLSHFTMREPLPRVANELFQWSAFTLYRTPNINQCEGTFMIIAGVIWTLRYEWLFYMALPLLSFVSGYKTNFKYVALSLASTIVLAKMVRPDFYLTASFAGGLLAAYVSTNESLRKQLQKKFFAAVALVLIVLGVWQHATSPSTFVLCFSLTFVVIACGNSFCGLLHTRPSYIFGQMGYSLYLLHGILLFTIYRFVVGYKPASQFAPWQHWALTLCLTPLLVFLCHLGYLYVERPAMVLCRKLLSAKKREQVTVTQRIRYTASQKIAD